MSDIIREPYELSIWETSIETNDVINFMPPLSTMYGDEWNKFNEKSTNSEYGGFLDKIKNDKSKIADYSKDWTEFSYTNAQDKGDDIYTFETTLELPAGKYVFCIQFKDLVEENLRTKESNATFNINGNGFEPLKNYIDSPYKLDFEIGETSKTVTIQFKVPWSGVQKKLLLLKYTTTSFVSFSTRLGLFSVTDGTTAENFEIPNPFPLYDGTDGSWIKKENKLCVIGSNDMTSENRIVNPTIKTNVNGEKTLTFTLYSRYFDADIGEFVNNNFVDLLHSESYLKLRRGFGNNAKWEEYIVKNIAENSENKTYTYTAKRAAAIELGKTGYDLEFSEELMNNQGTAIELTKQVFAGSDWTVEEAESDKFWGAVVEPVYKATLGNFSDENIKCIRQAKLGSYELYYNKVQGRVGFPKVGDDVYIPYSSYQNRTENGEIQLLWTEASDIEVDEDGVIYNANSYVLKTINTELLNNVEISGQIKGDNLQKRIKTRYIKGINRIVEEGTIGEKPIYKITDIEYQTDASVPELIVNGSDFQSTAGWRAHGSAAVIDLSTDTDSIDTIKGEEYVTSLQLKNESTTEDAYFYNAAIRSNATVIDNFTEGEEYYLAVKGLGIVNAFVSLYEYDDGGNVVFEEDKEDEEDEEDKNSGIILNFESDSTNGNELIFSAICSDSISKKEIIENNIGLFFKVGADSTLEIESVSLFKKVANENNGYYRPGDVVEAKTITKEIYYDPSLVNNTKATSMEEIVPTSGENFVPTYYEEYSKISSIKISKSNRFNILQEICEAFECWADLIVEHDERGNITNKKVRLKNFVGENKNIGFSYGINLKGINRTIVSDQIVTKLIVEPNNNENGLNGFTTIARAKNNKSKDIALYNFDYYIRQKALDSELVKKDIYDTKGLLYRLGKANSKIADLNGELIALQMQRTQIQSNLTTQKELYQAARDEIDQLRQDFYDRTGKFVDDITDFSVYNNDPTIKSIVVAIIAQNKVFNAAIDKMSDYELSYEENKKQIAGLESEIDIYKKDQQSYLNIFNDKYANYIQEGTWTDESYYDDDLYYFDAQNVLYTSAFPKISYTIDVIDVSPLGGQYTPFKFNVGDKTYIEDTEFFGWNISGTSPYKEEVVISEITENLDSPEQNKITVQNYKTQFEDLFQRIAATTQSLQYAAGGYQRAANKITSTNSIDTETIQNSFLNGIVNLQNMGNMSVSWTPEGLVISNQKDSNNRLRLSNVGIAQSEDGGDTWKMLVLAGRGITANSIVTGTLDANKISIKSGDAATFIWNAKGLRAYETTWIQNNPTPNVNFNNYIEFNDKGLIAYRNNGLDTTFALTAEGNLTLSGSLKVAVLEYGKVQAIGGIVLIRPSSLIKKAEYDEDSDQTKIWVETPSQFSAGDWCVIGSNLEDIGEGNNATPYEVLSIDETNKYLIFSGNLIETFGDLINLALTSIIDSNNNIGIAINSSTNEAFSNARSFSIFESTIENDTWIRDNRLILGQLPAGLLDDDYEFPEPIDGKSSSYGLYADNVILKGHIEATSGKIGNMEIAAVENATYRVVVTSSKGTSFIDNGLTQTTILTCEVYKGGKWINQPDDESQKENLAYQWSDDKGPINGATGRTYTVELNSNSQTAKYSCQVTIK